MTTEWLQEQCELGQRALLETKYLEAEALLVEAEALAWGERDFDTLSRLYMPLQEARRQRRQRCGEGVVCLDIWARNADEKIEPGQIVEKYPFGQLLVAGWGSIAAARGVREIQKQRGMYVETFLGAVYPTAQGSAIVIVPRESDTLPASVERSADELRRALPANSLIFKESELPQSSRQGTYATYAEVMAIWERLHLPFLAEADTEKDLVRRIELYRETIEVDYACELAHQRLADVARELARKR